MKSAARQNVVPSNIESMELWELNRRSFLRAALLAGAASQIAWFTSCSTQLEESNEYLTAEQSTILKSVLLIILPDDDDGPSADEINSFGYLLWVLGNDYDASQDKEFIITGLDSINELALEEKGTAYYELSTFEQEEIITQAQTLKWGKNWMSIMVTLVLESLLLDPIYGGNKDEKGWKWLNHVPGNPRPTEETRFEQFLENYKPYTL